MIAFPDEAARDAAMELIADAMADRSAVLSEQDSKDLAARRALRELAEHDGDRLTLSAALAALEADHVP